MKKVYIVHSICQDEYMVFSSEKKAKNWIESNNSAVKQIFDKSIKDDLYIIKRTVF